MKFSMMKMVLCVCLLCAFPGLVHADGHTKKGMNPDEMAIAKFMNTDMAAAWKSNKPGQVLELYSDSVPVLWYNTMSNKAVTNKDDREKELKAFFAKHKVMDFTASDISVTKVDDNLGFVTCTQKMLVADVETKKDAEIVMQALYEVVKEKDGTWKAYREMTFMGNAAN